MLVLSRKSQQSIHIGNDITISILKIKGNTVSVGIEAPRQVRIVRGELPHYDRPPTDETPAGSAAEPTPEARPLGVVAESRAVECRADSGARTGVQTTNRGAANSGSMRNFVQQRRANSAGLPGRPDHAAAPKKADVTETDTTAASICRRPTNSKPEEWGPDSLVGCVSP